MERKDFITNTCKACAGLLLGGALISLFESCATLPVVKAAAVNKTIVVDLSTVLPTNNLFIVKSKALDFSILVIKKSETLFTALYMQCTHERQPLGATTKGLYCAAHGSAFDLDGNVTIQPATAALTKFTTELNNNMLSIFIPKTT